jgi:hypothetical protein
LLGYLAYYLLLTTENGLLTCEKTTGLIMLKHWNLMIDGTVHTEFVSDFVSSHFSYFEGFLSNENEVLWFSLLPHFHLCMYYGHQV